jgi:hypothetical protein
MEESASEMMAKILKDLYFKAENRSININNILENYQDFIMNQAIENANSILREEKQKSNRYNNERKNIVLKGENLMLNEIKQYKEEN